MISDPSDANVAETTFVSSTMSDRAARLSDAGLFFRKFLSKGRAISSAVPSSRAMVAGVLRHVDFSRPATIVELGAGTGPVTEQILDRLRAHHRFVAVENDPDFCDVLRRRFPGIALIEGDATGIAAPLRKMGITRADYVISGLPTPNLPPDAVVRLWRWLRASMTSGGVFIQITVAPVLYRKFYHRLFESVRFDMIWLNVPPGGVYRCSRPRPHLRRIR